MLLKQRWPVRPGARAWNAWCSEAVGDCLTRGVLGMCAFDSNDSEGQNPL